MEKVNVFWHRRDLRYTDNTGLFYALDEGIPTLSVFVFDTNILDDLDDPYDARVQFIHSHISRLDEAYRANGSGLWVFHGTPEEAFKKLMADYTVNSVYTNRDYEPYAKERDQAIEGLLKNAGINFYTFKDQVIFEEGEILTDQGEPYKVFTPYKNKWLGKFQKNKIEAFNSEFKLRSLWKSTIPPIPSMESLGFKPTSIPIPNNILDDQLIQSYEQKRNFPAQEGTTRLGVHLRFGTLSIREAARHGLANSETWLNELIWREFYMMILAHYPKVIDQAFKKKYDAIPWRNDEEAFERWCEGRTGYPIVDAGMRELNATGYMHNRVRMVVASFLTKHLLIDWRWGERYFAKKLLDFELSSNNGGWQWAAGTGTDAQPYFRVFNPYSQQEKFDKDFLYIKNWVPEFGTDAYPDPIVNHKEARVRAIETYKESLS